MRILIDECLNWRLSRALTGHYAVSVQELSLELLLRLCRRMCGKSEPCHPMGFESVVLER
jgi:hypothetical protein